MFMGSTTVALKQHLTLKAHLKNMQSSNFFLIEYKLL